MIDDSKCRRLEELHKGDAFVIPNPWDVGSGRVLEGVGFKALATSSAGLACTLGLNDGDISLDDCLAHCRLLARATSVPVNCDFEDGFAQAPSDVAHNVPAVAHTGIAGCSVEDWSRDEARLYDFEHAVERVAAASEAARSIGAFQLTARAENLLHGVDDLDDTIKRLQAFANAGADVLYAPGIRSLDDLRTVTQELDPPFNVLGSYFPNAKIEELADAGARRISLGGALNWISIAALHRAARAMLEDGALTWLAETADAGPVRKYLG